MEGGESGFGSAQSTSTNEKELDGEHSRMKAVYVSYWLNRLQNLSTEQNIFVSLNPHSIPDESLTHKKLIFAHPQFTPATLCARDLVHSKFQGKDGVWFCGAWSGYGFQ